MVEREVRLLEKTVYYCSRCDQRVKEIDNIGQWKCKIRLRNPITGSEFEVRSDHGNVLKNPHFVLNVALAKRLPSIEIKDAISVKQIGDGSGNVKNVIVISRYYDQTNFYSDDFLKLKER